MLDGGTHDILNQGRSPEWATLVAQAELWAEEKSSGRSCLMCSRKSKEASGARVVENKGEGRKRLQEGNNIT